MEKYFEALEKQRDLERRHLEAVSLNAVFETVNTASQFLVRQITAEFEAQAWFIGNYKER